MSDDDNTPPNDDNPKRTRDNRGRWKPGHCPNKKGRPRKEKFKDYNQSDIRHFANTQIELMINGRPEKMDRKSALLNRMYQDAMNGKVTAQRKMMELFAQNDGQIAALGVHLDKLLYRWILGNPDYTGMDDLPVEVMHEIHSLASVLNHYYPGQYDTLLGKRQLDEDGKPA